MSIIHRICHERNSHENVIHRLQEVRPLLRPVGKTYQGTAFDVPLRLWWSEHGTETGRVGSQVAFMNAELGILSLENDGAIFEP